MKRTTGPYRLVEPKKQAYSKQFAAENIQNNRMWNLVTKVIVRNLGNPYAGYLRFLKCGVF